MREQLLEKLQTAAEQVGAELYAGFIRAKTDPMGVRAEALAVERVTARLRQLLTEAE